MISTDPRSESDAWIRLAVYRERYAIEDRLGPVRNLERSIQRRQVRLAAAERRVAELETMLSESRRERRVIGREIDESRRVGAYLIDEIIEQVRIDYREAWTPRPVRGFRMWRVKPGRGLYGAQVRWASPTMEAACLRDVPGDDIPHSEARCGPPACGVYATKRVEMFHQEGSGRLGRDMAIGVVAMSGKVIEHADGYRGARATVVAIVVHFATRWLMTADSRLIEAVFIDPVKIVLRLGEVGHPTDATIDAFLSTAREKEEAWI